MLNLREVWAACCSCTFFSILRRPRGWTAAQKKIIQSMPVVHLQCWIQHRDLVKLVLNHPTPLLQAFLPLLVSHPANASKAQVTSIHPISKIRKDTCEVSGILGHKHLFCIHLGWSKVRSRCYWLCRPAWGSCLIVVTQGNRHIHRGLALTCEYLGVDMGDELSYHYAWNMNESWMNLATYCTSQHKTSAPEGLLLRGIVRNSWIVPLAQSLSCMFIGLSA